ncbi:MAG: peptidoglycan DD-metalloendopeptidase family protein [Bacillota bacterium]|nr:peptidoglycan DD-metalloendopeptidase family protein [Bacillota bacterium]
MNRVYKRLAVVVAALMLAMCGGTTVYSSSTSQLKKQIAAADSKIAQSQKKLKQAKEKKTSAEEQKKIIDDQVSSIISNILCINNNIDDANAKIAEKEKELNEAQKKLDSNKEYFKKRVVSMYKSGTSTYLELLFGADDLGDFLNRVTMLQYVVKNDKNIVDEMTAARNTIAAAKVEIEDKKGLLEESKTLAQQQKSKLDETLSQQQAIIGQLAQEVKVNEADAAAAQKEKDALNKQLEKELAALKDTSTNSPPVKYSGGKMQWPIPQGGTITCPFGYRTYPSVGMHTGLDIAIKVGSTIAAAEAGTVIKIVNGTTGYGKYLMINHGNGVVTLYGHTSKIDVQLGQQVARGEKIAEVGSTGFSTGPHLHFEVRINGSAVNPIGYIT